MAKITIKREYAQVPNNLLNNKEISLKAKGLYAFIHGKPNEWDFSAEKIALQNKEGSSSIYKTLKELEDSGYLVRSKFQNSKGHWEIEYFLYEKPTGENPHSENPSSEKPVTGNPTVGNPTIGKPTNNSKKELVRKSSKKELVREGDFQNFLSRYYELSEKSPTSKNRLSSEREWVKFSEQEKQEALSRVEEFINHRKQTQEEQFGSWQSKFIPAPETYLKDRLWDELPNKVYVYAEKYNGVHGSGYRWRYSETDKPAMIGQKRVYWERKEGEKNRAYVYE